MKNYKTKPLPVQNVSVEEMQNSIGGIQNKLMQAAIAAASDWCDSMGGGNSSSGEWKYNIPCVDIPWINDFKKGGDGWSGLVDCNCVYETYKVRWTLLGMFP